jgi:hypothetical protein
MDPTTVILACFVLGVVTGMLVSGAWGMSYVCTVAISSFALFIAHRIVPGFDAHSWGLLVTVFTFSFVLGVYSHHRLNRTKTRRP